MSTQSSKVTEKSDKTKTVPNGKQLSSVENVILEFSVDLGVDTDDITSEIIEYEEPESLYDMSVGQNQANS